MYQCGAKYVRPAGLDTDYGVPVANCTETAPGVFERAWSKATVRVECGTDAHGQPVWNGTITPK